MMRTLIFLLLFGAPLCGNLFEIKVKELEHTYINKQLFEHGLVFEIILSSFDAVKCIDEEKIYLWPDKILPTDEGLLLIADNETKILLPKMFSDQYGCYIQPLTLCAACGVERPLTVPNCPIVGVFHEPNSL